MTPLATLDFTAQAAVVGLTVLTAAIGFDQKSERASRQITAFFLCFAISDLASLVISGWGDWISVGAIRWLHAVDVSAAYLLGPFFCNYVFALTTPTPRPAPASLWHALPFFLVAAFCLANAVAALDQSKFGRLVFVFVYHAWVVQGMPYLAIAVWRLHTSRAALEQFSADEAVLRLAWLRRLIAVIAIIWCLSAVQRFVFAAAAPDWLWLDTTLDWLMTIALYFLAWFGLRKQMFVPSETPVSASPASAPAASRYERSGLETDHSSQVASDLVRLMNTERLFTNPNLDLHELSQRSGWPPNYISQALNQNLRQNFFEFINGFRVAAAETCFSDVADRRTVLQIAMACGFGSKSTFNSVFKRITGLSPSAYRRTRSVEIRRSIA